MRLKQQMEDSGLFKYQAIVFVTHSMGGLIAKRVLVELNTPANANVLSRIAGILLLFQILIPLALRTCAKPYPCANSTVIVPEAPPDSESEAGDFVSANPSS